MDALLLKIPDVATQLGISRAKVYELMGAGDLPSLKVGGCRRVRVTDLHDFIERLSRTAESDRAARQPVLDHQASVETRR